MTTNTQIIPQEITPDLILRLTSQEVSSGRALGENGSISSIRGLPRHRENRIANRLGALQAQGREAKIKALINQLQAANLSSELRSEVNNWLELFSSIDGRDLENRAYSFGALIFRVLRPALLRVTEGERVSLVEFEDSCHSILQQMLPMGALDGFLESCERALIEERIYRFLSERIEFVGQLEMNAINTMHSQLDARIRSFYESFKERLNALQENRRNMIASTDTALEGVATRVEALGSTLLTQMTSIRDMGAMDPQLDRSLHELESILRRGLR